MAETEQGVELTGQLEQDVDVIARALARVLGDVAKRIEGVRDDFTVSMLQQAALTDKRFERLEALVVERFGEDVAAELQALLRDS